MKILHIITDRNIGGAGKLLCYFLAEADRGENEYHVIVPAGSALKAPLEALGVPLTEVDYLYSSRCPKAYKALLAVIRATKPDVVHTHSCYTAQKAAKRAGVPHRVLTKHCSDLPSRFRRSFFCRLFARLFYFRSIDAAIATDDSAAAALTLEGMSPKKITVIYNGAPSLPVTAKEELNSLREQLRIPAGKFLVGYFGRLEPEKGPEVLLQAAALCHRFTPDVHFLLCGDGSQRAELETLADRYGIRDIVTFAGFKENVAPYMQLCKVIASPSLGVETSSLSLCEGLSLGLCPVVSDVGGSASLIGDCGIVVPPDQPAALHTAIMTLARDPDLCALYSRKARERYAARCTASRMAKETEAFYRALVAR